MNKIDRYKILIRYCKQQKIADSQKDLGSMLGYTNESSFSQVINGKVEEPKDFIERLCKLIPNLSRNWLENGFGEMILDDITIEQGKAEFVKKEKESVQPKNHDNTVWIPVLNLDARGGFLPNEVTDTGEHKMTVMPFSKDVARDGDVVIPVYGDSMYPRYPSGSYILLREVNWQEYLELSVPYVIELKDYRRLIKIVTKGDDNDHFRLHSVNPDFEDTEVSKTYVNRMFLVVMMLKKEIM